MWPHGWPVKSLIIVCQSLFPSDLHMKNDVTHLKFEAALRTLSAHEFRPLHFFSSFGSGRSQDTFPFGGTLRCRVAGPAFRLSPAIHLPGFCATDWARGTARHGHLFERKSGGALSLGLSRTGGQIDFGRCQRATRLAFVGGLGEKPQAQSQAALCRRRPRSGVGKPGLCAGLHDQRSFAHTVSLGRLPPHQSRNQEAHPSRFARSDSHLYLHHQRPPARRSLARRTCLRAWGLLRAGSRLHGFQTPERDRRCRSVLRHASQRQTALLPPTISADGFPGGCVQRPDGKTHLGQSAGGLPGTVAKGALLRRRDGTGSGLSDQPSRNPSAEGGPDLPAAVADRVVLPLDQRSVSYTHLRAHETRHDLVCRLLLEKKKEKSEKTENRMVNRNRLTYKSQQINEN